MSISLSPFCISQKHRRSFAAKLPGMSLVEMLMAIAILSLGMGGVTLLFINSWTNNKFILETGNASRMASRGANDIVSDLRKVRQADNGDFPVEAADDFDLKVYLDIDNDGATERVHYYLSGSTLYRGVTDPVSGLPITYPNSDDSTTTLATAVVNTSSDPIFIYYNADYPTDTVNNPLSTPASVSQVRMVRVHLMINIDPFHAPDHINIESLAQLRNLTSY